jgi:chorismate mutase
VQLSEEPHWHAALVVLRNDIDKIDAEIIRLLGERGRLVHQVGELKPHVGAVRDPKREGQVVERAALLAAENGLEADFGRDLYHFLLNYFATREEVQVMERSLKS